MSWWRQRTANSWHRTPEVWVPAIYAVAAALWIYASDYVLALLVDTTSRMRAWSTLKGWLFVVSTAGLLLVLLRRVFKRMRQAQRDLEASREQLKVWNETLEARVAERTALAERRAAELRALALELARAEQRERRRVAQILHESFQQLLVAAKFNISLLENHPERPAEVPLGSIRQAVDEAIRVARLLTVELCPPILYDVGLAQAFQWLARWMQERHALQVQVILPTAVVEPPEEDLRVMLFHAVRELLLNVVRHSGVRSAQVEMTCQDNQLRIAVTDDGCGFDPLRRPEQRDLTAGYGLFSIRERIEQIAGRLEVTSAPGHGTRVCLIVPICRELTAA